MWRSARTPNTAKASASSIVLTPPKPATSPRRAKSGATTKFIAASRPFPSRPDGLLFVGDFSGFVHCLDAETGKVYWVHDLKAHMWGSTLVADGKVYCGDEDGDLFVFAASKEKKILSETNLGGADLFHAGRGQRRALRPFQHPSVRLLRCRTQAHGERRKTEGRTRTEQTRGQQMMKKLLFFLLVAGWSMRRTRTSGTGARPSRWSSGSCPSAWLTTRPIPLLPPSMMALLVKFAWPKHLEEQERPPNPAA